jgi:hypothetical protein
MALHRPLQSLSDDHLLAGLADVAGQSRRAESSLVAHIAEVDYRRLFARYACSSMFVYCTRMLHLAEGEAFRRIRVARASRRHPVLLEMLADGRLHVSGIAVLVRLLTAENRDRLLSLAVHKTKRQIQKLVAEIYPQPDVASVMRRLPQRPPAPTPAAPCDALIPGPATHSSPLAAERPVGLVPGAAVGSTPAAVAGAPPHPVPASIPVIEPLSASRYRVQFTAGEDFHDDVERLRGLLQSEIPDGDLGAIVGKAVRELRRRLEARRFALTSSPRKALVRTTEPPASRYLDNAVRRAVYLRDGGRCRFEDAQGRRCPERHRLEYHHRHPYGLGGTHDLDNICLMCGPHNRYLAELDYGKKVMSRYLDRPERPEPSAVAMSVGGLFPGSVAERSRHEPGAARPSTSRARPSSARTRSA